MLSLICYVLGGILFLGTGANQTIFNLNGLREVGWGLFFCVLARLLGGVGPAAPWVRAE